MKLLIIHLGDIHLSADSDYSYNRKKRISDAINAIGSFDDCIMVFSGDVTQSGGANEVKAAFSFISLICSELKKLRPSIHDIQVLIVPGNHDIQLDDVTDKGQSAIDAVRKALHINPCALSRAEQLELFTLINARFDKRIAQYHAGERLWDFSSITVLVAEGIKPC